MNYSNVGISFVLYLGAAHGFTAPSSAFVSLVTLNRGVGSAVRAHVKFGPKIPEDDAAALETLIHPGGCPCCVAPDYAMSARAARIEVPLKALFAAGAMTAFAGSARADEVDETPAAPSEETPAPIPASEEETPEPVDSAPAAEETKPEPPAVEEPKQVDVKPKTFDEALNKYFPKAMTTSVVATKVEDVLSKRKFTRANTLFGTSVCPDEINSKPTRSLPAALQNAMTDLNGVFHLGGLGGLPYMGAAGMGDFLSHCPTNGKVLIMYGPHVGITDEGVVGSVERLGKFSPSPDCDTIMNAYKAAQKEIATKPIDGPDKREQYVIANFRTALESSEASKLSKDALPAYVTYKMFDLVKEQILKQLQLCLKDNVVGRNVAWDSNIDEIVLLGGIVVNRGQMTGSIEPREDYFEPLVFDSYVNPGNFGTLTDSKDLFQPAFGDKPIPFFAT